MREVVILSAARSAGGKFGGSLQNVPAPELGAAVIREAVRRAGVSAEVVEQTIFGNAWQAGVGPNAARLAHVKAGLPVDSPAVAVNVRCGSSLQALIFGAQAIRSGDLDCVMVGGTESTSNVPYSIPAARWGARMGSSEMEDLMHKDGFRCPLGGGLMGEITERLAQERKITRAEQDELAVESHRRAEIAVKEGKFRDEIAAVPVPGKKGEQTPFDREEIYREGMTLDALAKLPPVFKRDGGTITAGNACALCDAASAVLLMERSRAASLGLSPLALLRSAAFVGIDPASFGLSPVKASHKALEKAKLVLGDVDLVELNEAFAAQAIACERDLGLDHAKVNVHGGAIALGHPVAATGTKILTTLLYAMKHRNVSVGLVTLCIGGGNGVAAVVERV